MTTLATEIYRQLRARARTASPSITYAELAEVVSRKIATHQRSPHLHAALGEVTAACRAHRLPCLPAIVWRSDTQRPSDGYYKVAHPRVRTAEGRLAAWKNEHERVVQHAEQFPASL
jgi:hypothetical protein